MSLKVPNMTRVFEVERICLQNQCRGNYFAFGGIKSILKRSIKCHFSLYSCSLISIKKRNKTSVWLFPVRLGQKVFMKWKEKAYM